MVYLCEVFVNGCAYVKKKSDLCINKRATAHHKQREKMTKTQLLRKVERLLDNLDKVFYWVILIGASYFIIRTIVG